MPENKNVPVILVRHLRQRYGVEHTITAPIELFQADSL